MLHIIQTHLAKASLLVFVGLSILGCVPKQQFESLQNELNQQQDSLQHIIHTLTQEKDTLQDALSFEKGSTHALLLTQDKLQDRLDVLQNEIDQLGKNASSTEQNLFANINKKNSEIDELQAQIARIKAVGEKNDERLNNFLSAIDTSLQKITLDSINTKIRAGQLIIAISEKALFKTNSTSKLQSQGKELLLDIADLLLKYPEMNMHIIGHTDNQANKREGLNNWQYSALRATSIAKYLGTESDLGSNRIMPASKSEYAPLTSNEDKAGRALNRRIELVIAPPRAYLDQQLLKAYE